MTAAANPHNTLTGSVLMAAETNRAAAEGRDAPETDTERESVWESEGGTSPAAPDSRSGPAVARPGSAERS
jgi:hypothetical protein